jgi:hypothetical protein
MSFIQYCKLLGYLKKKKQNKKQQQKQNNTRLKYILHTVIFSFFWSEILAMYLSFLQLSCTAVC